MGPLRWAAFVSCLGLASSCGGRSSGDAAAGAAAGGAETGKGGAGAAGTSISGSAGSILIGGTGSGGSPSGLSPCRDSDGDGLNDLLEGFYAPNPDYSSDDDRDLVANYLDLDSDGDGLPDAIEGAATPCDSAAMDFDNDGAPDYLDRDSDDDGLEDEVEPRLGFDGRSPDTNGDGCGDFIEYAFGACGSNLFIVEHVCYGSSVAEVTLTMPANLGGMRSDLETLITPMAPAGSDTPVQAIAKSVTPVGAGLIEDPPGTLTAVGPSAKVTFELSHGGSSEPSRAYLLSVHSLSYGTLAEAQIVWRGGLSCPIPK